MFLIQSPFSLKGKGLNHDLVHYKNKDSNGQTPSSLIHINSVNKLVDISIHPHEIVQSAYLIYQTHCK